MKTLKALGVAFIVAGSFMALPAMADPDLEGTIQDISICDGIKVLGKTSTITASTIITEEGGGVIGCGTLDIGDRVKVGCTDKTCDTAASIKFNPNSSESSVASVIGCPAAVTGFTLSNGVFCDLTQEDGPTVVKQDKKKNFLGLVPPSSTGTVADLQAFLCAATLGTTPGTLLVKCSGHVEGPPGTIDASKVELKQ